ncbi:type II secretion system protein [Cytobacillus sp. FJAT-54145]|uniref:Type II secretion system protein n=1 Tax=Cytobacillus spartinae TaxID=3299023 RepID=A0ABW6KIP2_9BACI
MKNRVFNERGLTLIELLAVLVILGIISAIAVVSIVNLVNKSRDQAMVANAIALRDSAIYYVKDQLLNSNVVGTQISYETLYNENFIETIKDPDTGEILNPETNESYVVVNGETITAVCFKGAERNLCSNDGEEPAIPIAELSTSLITKN